MTENNYHIIACEFDPILIAETLIHDEKSYPMIQNLLKMHPVIDFKWSPFCKYELMNEN